MYSNTTCSIYTDYDLGKIGGEPIFCEWGAGAGNIFTAVLDTVLNIMHNDEDGKNEMTITCWFMLGLESFVAGMCAYTAISNYKAAQHRAMLKKLTQYGRGDQPFGFTQTDHFLRLNKENNSNNILSKSCLEERVVNVTYAQEAFCKIMLSHISKDVLERQPPIFRQLFQVNEKIINLGMQKDKEESEIAERKLEIEGKQKLLQKIEQALHDASIKRVECMEQLGKLYASAQITDHLPADIASISGEAAREKEIVPV